MEMKYWFYQHKTAIHFGPDSLDKLKDVAAPLAGDAKILLVIDNNDVMEKTGVLGRVTDALGRDRVVIFNKVPPNPPAEIIHEGADLYKSEGCKLIVGLGGGSPLDASKAIGLMCNNEGPISDYIHRRKPWGPKTEPVIAIPTTAGTGSEVNANIVATLPEDNAKYGVAVPCAWPVAAIIDPKLTLSLPKNQTGSTGLDALSHALDSLWAVRAQSLSDMNAYEAIPIIMKWLPVAYEDGANLEARTNMSYAAMIASLAFGNTGTAAMHGFSYILTSKWGLPHGFACAFTMAEFFEYNFEAMGKERGERLLAALDVSSCEEGTEKIRRMCLAHGTPAKLGDLGITEADLPELVSAANPLNVGNNIRKVSEADNLAIWKKKL